MFEKRHEPLLPRAAFLWRLFSHFIIAVGIVLGSLMIGIFGYHYLDGLAWIDALLNAAMILGGMGPVNQLHTSAGKIFAACYALYLVCILLQVRWQKAHCLRFQFFLHSPLELTAYEQ